MSNNNEAIFDTQEIEEQEIVATTATTQTAEKPRVQKMMLLGGMMINDKKTKAVKGVNLTLLDAVELDSKTGQPILRGFSPTITVYVNDPKVIDAALDLLRAPVFSIVYAKISGNENFYRFHGVLTHEQVEYYRKIMDDLV